MGRILAPTGLNRGGHITSSIASALEREFGRHRGAIKAVVDLTAANERAVKNWFEGRNAPCGEFLIILCRHSDEVLETVLGLAGRGELIASKRVIDAKSKLREILTLIDAIDDS